MTTKLGNDSAAADIALPPSKKKKITLQACTRNSFFLHQLDESKNEFLKDVLGPGFQATSFREVPG